MKKKYHLEYEETQQTFTDMYQVFYDDRSNYFYKLIITIVGALMLFIQISVNPARLEIMFLSKYLLLWTLAFVLGYLLAKHVIKGINAQYAVRTGEEKYRSRVDKCGSELLITMDFYEENFTVLFQNEKKEYSYKEVSRMIASDKFYGLVVGGVYGNKEMVGFPASALNVIDKEMFLSDMERKCQNVAGGFKKR